MIIYLKHCDINMSGIVRDMISKSLADFMLDLYSELIEPDKNLFISPYSIFTALAMVYAGAKNLTENEMSKVMHIDMDQDILHPTIKDIMQKLLSYKEIELNVANSLWTQTGYQLLESYLELMDMNYKGSVFREDFASSSAGAAKINSWVAEKTNNKITQVIEERPIDKVKLILINAIYFKAKWSYPFEEMLTKAKKFILLSGDKIGVLMMQNTAYYAYLDEGAYHALSIPYKGRETLMIIYLPKKIDGILEMEKELKNINITEQATRFASEKVRLSLPKFKIETEYQLKKNLMDLGMKQAFTNDANFSGITDHPDGLEISEVIHKTFIEVEEWGTEAAAVTILTMAPTGPPPGQVEPPIEFRVDHPFIFHIYDSISKSILFTGRVTRPTETTDKVLTLEEEKEQELKRLRSLLTGEQRKLIDDIQDEFSKKSPPPPPPLSSPSSHTPNIMHELKEEFTKRNKEATDMSGEPKNGSFREEMLKELKRRKKEEKEKNKK